MNYEQFKAKLDTFFGAYEEFCTAFDGTLLELQTVVSQAISGGNNELGVAMEAEPNTDIFSEALTHMGNARYMASIWRINNGWTPDGV